MAEQKPKPPIEGVRVLRGPDWLTSDDADGGEGHLGTVQECPSEGVVNVLWDIGQQSTCKTGQDGKFDLRVFDTATVGVHHPDTCCAGCGEQPIAGIMWRCHQCLTALHLCSLCYADDKHDLRHRFLRIDLPGTSGTAVKKRNVSVRIRAVGLFPGAKVTRGKNWEWKDQDGGAGTEGEVLEILNSPNHQGQRNLVRVLWPSGEKNVYRLAFEGHVDVTCSDEEAGGFYYRDHLPCLDTTQFSTRETRQAAAQDGDAESSETSDPSAAVDAADVQSIVSETDTSSSAPDIAESAADPQNAADRSTVPAGIATHGDGGTVQPSLSAQTSVTTASEEHVPTHTGEGTSLPNAVPSSQSRTSDGGTPPPAAVTESGAGSADVTCTPSDLQVRAGSRDETPLATAEADSGKEAGCLEVAKPSDPALAGAHHVQTTETASGRESVALPSADVVKDATLQSAISGRHSADAVSDTAITASEMASLQTLPGDEDFERSASSPQEACPTDKAQASRESGREGGREGGSSGDEDSRAELTELTRGADVHHPAAPPSPPASLVVPVSAQSHASTTLTEAARAEFNASGGENTGHPDDIPHVDSSTAFPDKATTAGPKADDAGKATGSALSSTTSETPKPTTPLSEVADVSQQVLSPGEAAGAITAADPLSEDTASSDSSPRLCSPGSSLASAGEADQSRDQAPTGSEVSGRNSTDQASASSEQPAGGTSAELTPSPRATLAADGNQDGQWHSGRDTETPNPAQSSQSVQGTPPALEGKTTPREVSAEEGRPDHAAKDTSPSSLPSAGTEPTQEMEASREASVSGNTDGHQIQLCASEPSSHPEPAPAPQLSGQELGTTAAAADSTSTDPDPQPSPLPLQEQEGATTASSGEISNDAMEGGSGSGVTADGKDFTVGSKAVIGVPEHTLREMQFAYGGVTHTMIRKIGREGTVAKVLPGGAVHLRLGKVVFRLNPDALLKTHRISKGDTVRIREDLYLLNVLNERLGWRSSMDQTMGKVGEVVGVDDDGDMRVKFGAKCYIYSPGCCVPAPGCAVDFLGGRDAQDVSNNLKASAGLGLGGDTSLQEKLGRLLGGGGGGGRGGGHRIRLSDLAQMSSQLGGLGDISGHLGSLTDQLGQLTGGGGGGGGGLGGLMSLVGGDEGSAEGQLQKAILTGDMDQLKEMCQADYSLLDRACQGVTPLMLAAHQGRRKALLTLLDLGADVNAAGLKAQSPLIAALDEKQEEMALLLLEHGANVRQRNGKERTPLHCAVFNHQNEAAQLLLHMGADINAQDKYGDTALHDGIARHNTVMVDLLLQQTGLDLTLINKKGYNPLQFACRMENAQVVGLILAVDNSNVNQLKEQDLSALHICVKEKFIEGVRLLLTVGNADVNLPSGRHRLTALHIACLQGSVDIVETLVDLGAAVNVQEIYGESPLHLAMGGNDASITSYEARQECVQKRVRMSCLLITHGAFVDATNKKGRPPTTYGHAEVQMGVMHFIEQNPGLVQRKSVSGSSPAARAGPMHSAIITSPRDVSMTCKLCQGPSDVRLMPCGHRSVCDACASAQSLMFCPLCGREVDSRERVGTETQVSSSQAATSAGAQSATPALPADGGSAQRKADRESPAVEPALTQPTGEAVTDLKRALQVGVAGLGSHPVAAEESEKRSATEESEKRSTEEPASEKLASLTDVHEERSQSDGGMLRVAICRESPAQSRVNRSAEVDEKVSTSGDREDRKQEQAKSPDRKQELTKSPDSFADDKPSPTPAGQDNRSLTLKSEENPDNNAGHVAHDEAVGDAGDAEGIAGASSSRILGLVDLEADDLVLPDVPSMGMGDWLVHGPGGAVNLTSQPQAPHPPATGPWGMDSLRTPAGKPSSSRPSPAQGSSAVEPGRNPWLSPTPHREPASGLPAAESKCGPQVGLRKFPGEMESPAMGKSSSTPPSARPFDWAQLDASRRENSHMSQKAEDVRRETSPMTQRAEDLKHERRQSPEDSSQSSAASPLNRDTPQTQTPPAGQQTPPVSQQTAETEHSPSTLTTSDTQNPPPNKVTHVEPSANRGEDTMGKGAIPKSSHAGQVSQAKVGDGTGGHQEVSDGDQKSGSQQQHQKQQQQQQQQQSQVPGGQRQTGVVTGQASQTPRAAILMAQHQPKQKEDFQLDSSRFETLKTFMDTDNLSFIFSDARGAGGVAQPEGDDNKKKELRERATVSLTSQSLASTAASGPGTTTPVQAGRADEQGSAGPPGALRRQLSASEGRLDQGGEGQDPLSQSPAPTPLARQKSHSADSIRQSDPRRQAGDDRSPAHPEKSGDGEGGEMQEGERVVLGVGEERLVELQHSFGGTTPGMLQCVAKLGTVTGRTKLGAVSVRFKTRSYRFNPRALMRVHEHRVGDPVRVRGDLDVVMLLNRHVGFGSGVVESLDKVGKVTNIDQDGDLTVSFGQCNFRYSPACCLPAPGCTPDTLTAGNGNGNFPTAGNGATGEQTDGESAERQAYMQQLARMVKEGFSVRNISTSPGDDSSVLSRLFEAIKDDNLTLVRQMCQSDPSLIHGQHEGRRLTTLMYASWRGKTASVSLLLDMGADVNGRFTLCQEHDSRYPLLAALESKEEETAVLLLERGADPSCRSSINGRTPLHMAANLNLVQVAQVLLTMGVDINYKDVHGDSPIMDALLTDSRAVADILLDLPGLDLTLTNAKGMTPLHAACHKNNSSAVEGILTRGMTPVNALMEGGYAAMHLAAEFDGAEIIRLMALLGSADVNIRVGGSGDHAQETPLHRACLRGHFSCVEALLDFGAEVNVENKERDTPLHLAMGGRISKDLQGESELMFLEERVRIVCTLISNGAFVDVENRKGRTCMRYGGPAMVGAVQDFMDRNRHLVKKRGGSSSSSSRDDGHPPTLVLRGVALPCGVCRDKMSDVTLLPCGHKAVCQACSDQLTSCPQCQRRVDSTTQDDHKAALFEPVL